jgi:hypothetical protein
MNHRHLLTALKLSLVAFVMAAIGASHAHAQDAKSYPGLTCVKRVANAASPVYEENGTIGNNSTTTLLHLGCLIVRDRISAVSSAWVQVLDLHGDQNIECRIISAERSGNTVNIHYSFPRQSAAVGGSQLLWTSPTALGLPSPTGLTHYLLSCTVPPRTTAGVSKIITYRTVENPGTD